MPLMRCPRCGSENFTMDGWEDLDHCSSCGKPLAEPQVNPVETREDARRDSGGGTERPRPA